jgi:hypothetical protein
MHSLGATTSTYGPSATISGTLEVSGNVRGTTTNGFLNWLGDSGATVNMRFTDTGLLLVGDTSNVSMTVGLTLNQGAADDEILAFKSSDVDHGVTTLAETDTYGSFTKAAATTGGLVVNGFGESSVGVVVAATATTVDTTKSTAGLAATLIVSRLKSGTGATVMGANANLLAIRTHTTTRFIFDEEGDAHADVSWTTFDRHHDLAVIEDLETLLAPGQVARRFGRVIAHDRAFFEREGLLHDVREEAPGRVRGMLNTTRLLMLHSGAIREVGGRQARLEEAFRYLAHNPSDGPGALALLEA